MTGVAMWTGYAFMATCAWGALLWAWEKFLNTTWKQLTASDDFFRLVVRYAKEKKRTEVAGHDE